MLSILGAVFVVAALLGLLIWCLILSDELYSLKSGFENHQFHHRDEPTRRNAEIEKERGVRADQIKAIRQRVRYLEWMFRKIARGEPVPPSPETPA